MPGFVAERCHGAGSLVCRTLAELLPQPGIQRLRRHLPELAPLFDVPAAPPHVQGPHHLRSSPGPENTLAGGKRAVSGPSLKRAARVSGIQWDRCDARAQ